MLRNRIKEAEVISLGSAYSYYDLYYYKGLPIKCVSLAGLPQYLDYDLKYVKKYHRLFKKGVKVLIVLPEFVFAVNSRERSKLNKSYYYKFWPWEITDFSLKDFITTWTLLLPRTVRHKGGVVVRRIKNLFGHYPILTPEEKKLEGKKRIEGWKRELKVPSVQSAEIPFELKKYICQNIEYLDEIIRTVKNACGEPIIIIPPVSHFMLEEISRECLEAYLFNPIERREDKSVKVFNYVYDNRFISDELYRNADWLNHKGGKAFVDTVMKDIKMTGREEG